MRYSPALHSGPSSQSQSDVSDSDTSTQASATDNEEDNEDNSISLSTEGNLQEKVLSKVKENGDMSRTSIGDEPETWSPVTEEKMHLPAVSPCHSPSITDGEESRSSDTLSVEDEANIDRDHDISESKYEMEFEEEEEEEVEKTLSEARLHEQHAVGDGEEREQFERVEDLLERESEQASSVEEEEVIQEEEEEEHGEEDYSGYYEPVGAFNNVEGSEGDVAVMVDSTSEFPLPQDEEEEGREDHPEHSNSTPSIGGDTEECSNFHVGNQVLIGNKMMGVVRFVGHTHFAAGLWVGVEIGVPKGRNDGSINGHRYFSCDSGHGLFAPPHKLTVISDESKVENSETENIFEQVISDIEEVEENEELREEEPEEDVRKHEEGTTGMQENYIERDDSDHAEMEGDHANRNVSSGSLISEDIPTGSQGSLADSLNFSSSLDQPIPAAPSDIMEDHVQGERDNGFPLAPEVAMQHSQLATPIFAPPPEFAGGASSESSSEPPNGMLPDVHKTITFSERNSLSNHLSEELVQDLTNEAFDSMQRIKCSKQQHVFDKERNEIEEDLVKEDISSLKMGKPMSLEEKADLVTDQLLSALIKSESNLACDIYTQRTSSTETTLEEGKKNDIEVPSSDAESSLVLLSLQRTPPYPLNGANSGFLLQGSSEYSPPGSPRRHLSALAVAKVNAGDMSPPLSPTPQSPSPPPLKMSTSVESIVHLLDCIKITTAQSMVPSQRETVDQIVACAWDEANHVGFHHIHSIIAPGCHRFPGEILAFINDRGEDEGYEDGLSPAEVECRDAYVGLVYQATLEMLHQLHPVKTRPPVWASHCTTRSLLVPTHFASQDLPSLIDVQKRVYASLMRGQPTHQLLNIKLLHQMKRPGGREVDFVDQVLIQELRREEPEWVDYSRDEMSVKEKTADALLESLVMETAQVLSSIAEKKMLRELHGHQQTSRTTF